MDLYKYHNNPDVLPGHHKKDELLDTQSPKEFFARYKNRPDELKKRESAIAKYSIWSYEYSKILGTRFPLGEPAIFASKGYDCMFYLKDYPECMKDYPESFIAKNEVLSYWYSDLVLKARFPLGEPIIFEKASTYLIRRYLDAHPECMQYYREFKYGKKVQKS